MGKRRLMEDFACQPQLFEPWSESSLAALCVELGAKSVPSFSPEEEALVSSHHPVEPLTVADVRQRILAGHDPLGKIFMSLRAPSIRRSSGATYTPKAIVQAMLTWADALEPGVVVDPGVGSARFLRAAAAKFPGAHLFGCDVDPLATLMARAVLATLGHAHRSEILRGDYRDIAVPARKPRLFIGNPPYVRHHQIEPIWKEWLTRQSKLLNCRSTQLAGLHVHFYLATALKAEIGDHGCFITAAEWLDVHYGSLVRDLFLKHLGGRAITVIEPEVQPFADAATTAAITYFSLGLDSSPINLARVDKAEMITRPEPVHQVSRDRLAVADRWSHFTRVTQDIPEGYIELGELCRVHRGAVTGANRVWVTVDSHSLPESVLYPSVTRANELFKACGVLQDASALKKVIDIPEDLDVLPPEAKRQVEAYLKIARSLGADRGYIARNRKAWWSVGLKMPAPILATYMARRPPAFVRNLAQARHINIAHGLYPRAALEESVLTALARYLSENTNVYCGRTYSGGLTKFEPREMERLLVPAPEFLMELA